MKKFSALFMGILAVPMTISAVDYTPAAPDPVTYETCFVQTRVLRDANGDRVTSVGDQGDVKVIGQRISTGDVYRPCGKITCTINNTYDDGKRKIANDKMQYRILVLHKGQSEEDAEPYTFDAEAGYLKWEQNDYEPMTWLDNNFTDSYDLGLSLGSDGGPNLHSIYFYGVSDDIEKIGVQSRWERSGNVFESEITWADPTTPDLEGVLTWDEWKALEEKYQTDFVPTAPEGLEYTACQVETYKVLDEKGQVVTSVGDNGEVKVINRRKGTDDKDYPYGIFNFTIPNTYNKGDKTMANDLLEYRVLVLDKGASAQAKAFVFDAETGYLKWKENGYAPMEWVKNDFTDSYDLELTVGEDGAPNQHKIYLFVDYENVAKVGVQSRWQHDDETFESAITWVEATTPDLEGALTWDAWVELRDKYLAGVDEIAAEAQSVEYFDLQGRRVANPDKGLYIVKTTTEKGNVKVTKVIK